MSEVPARCAPFEEDLSALLDGQLDASRAAEVRLHVASCADCTRRVDALRGVDVALRSIAATPIDAGQRDRMRPALAAERAAHRAPPRRRRRWLAPAAFAATAAAAAAVLLVLRPVAPEIPIGVAAPATPAASKTRADAEVIAQEMAAKIDTPIGANAPSDLLDDASDEDLALAMALREAPAVDSPGNPSALRDRIAAMKPEEQQALRDQVARLRQMTPAELDQLRARLQGTPSR